MHSAQQGLILDLLGKVDLRVQGFFSLLIPHKFQVMLFGLRLMDIQELLLLPKLQLVVFQLLPFLGGILFGDSFLVLWAKPPPLPVC